MRILFITLSLLTISNNSFANNICRLIKKNPTWKKSAKLTENKWGVPMEVQFAIIEQESEFKAYARSRRSSARGYAQALNEAWRDYQLANHVKRSRNDFRAASDFIGWYGKTAKKNYGVSPKNAYQFYVIYHEGFGGYHTFQRRPKATVKSLARHVSVNARRYKKQLQACT